MSPNQLVGGELGGGKVVKYSTGSICLMLWATYIVVASLKAYGIIDIGGGSEWIWEVGEEPGLYFAGYYLLAKTL